ncbi:TetR family transcriptional regulator [Gordonia sp. CPCC 206044]|uniref:TetR/AcrR family transcriptional regulator n=1 Tax=Gordonia sp. CPCC 206044 TaxID=3140793 RepID=UPI003AF37318
MADKDRPMTTIRERRSDRGEATREAVLTAAEELFAIHGVGNVPQRRIVEAAGQANTGAIAYHFGSTADLVRAIERRHAEHIDQLLTQRAAAVGDSDDLADWVACLVRPFTEHLASLGTPSWYARFCVQVTIVPTYAEIMTSSALTSPPLHDVLSGISRCLPDLPAHVTAERSRFSTLLLVQGCAEYEAAFDYGRDSPRTNWDEVAGGLIDAMTGLWCAPVRTP